MIEEFNFADSEEGKKLRDTVSLSLLENGFTVEHREEVVAHFTLLVLAATPPKKATRADRGCLI